MHALDTCFDSSIYIGHGQIIVIMGMKIKMDGGVTLHHTATVLQGSVRVKDSQGIGQHHTPYRHGGQGIHKVKHIFWRAFHAVAPVFKIYVHLHAAAHGILYRTQNIFNMLSCSLAQLCGNMLQATLAEQVHNTASGTKNPIGRPVLVNKTQHLKTVRIAVTGSPFGNTAYAILLTVRYHGRCNLHAIHVEVRQQ